jgi:hypothetical protein
MPDVVYPGRSKDACHVTIFSVNPSKISESTIPPELLVPPPRAVARVKSGCAVVALRLFILPHTLVGIGALLFAVGEPLLILFSASVPGVVQELTTHQGSKGSESYRVKIEYFPDARRNGAGLLLDEGLTAGEYRAMHRGQSVSVRTVGLGRLRYATLARSVSGYIRQRWPMWIFTAFWNGVISIALYVAWVAPIRGRHLVRDGRPVIGKITGKSTRRGKSITYTVMYEFVTADVRPLRQDGEMSVSGKDYDSASEGRGVTVLYNSNRPSRNVIYEFSDFKAAKF